MDELHIAALAHVEHRAAAGVQVAQNFTDRFRRGRDLKLHDRLKKFWRGVFGGLSKAHHRCRAERDLVGYFHIDHFGGTRQLVELYQFTQLEKVLLLTLYNGVVVGE